MAIWANKLKIGSQKLLNALYFLDVVESWDICLLFFLSQRFSPFRDSYNFYWHFLFPLLFRLFNNTLYYFKKYVTVHTLVAYNLLAYRIVAAFL